MGLADVKAAALTPRRASGVVPSGKEHAAEDTADVLAREAGEEL